MEISEDLRCMFSAEVTERDDSYVVEVPKREVELESVREGAVYRVVVLASNASASAGSTVSNGSSPESQSDAVVASNADEAASATTDSEADSPSSSSSPTPSTLSTDEPEPPVDRGEELVVDIESIGDQGDGIARVDRGYVIIVPDTDKGERVRINVTSVKQNVAFGEVVDRIDGHIFE